MEEKNKKLRASIVVGYKSNGKQIRKYAYGNTKAELEKNMTELKYLYNRGVDLANDDILMRQIIELWKQLRLVGKSRAYTNECNRLIKNYIEPGLGHYKLKNIKPYMVQIFINEIVVDKKYNTARKVLQMVKSMFEIAVANDFLYKSPTLLIKFPKYTKQERLPLSRGEQDKIMKSTHKYADLFQFLLLTGLRRGEVCALTWSDIDFESGVIHITKACDYTRNQPVIKGTKTGRYRDIPLLDKTREILERRANKKRSLYIFHKQNGDILSETAIKKMTDSFCKEVEVRFSLHQLRHTFCTNLYYAGVSSKKAQQLMGHSTLAVTMEIYTHLDEEREDNTIELLNKFI